jgi:hypothetical protein
LQQENNSLVIVPFIILSLAGYRCGIRPRAREGVLRMCSIFLVLIRNYSFNHH